MKKKTFLLYQSHLIKWRDGVELLFLTVFSPPLISVPNLEKNYNNEPRFSGMTVKINFLKNVQIWKMSYSRRISPQVLAVIRYTFVFSRRRAFTLETSRVSRDISAERHSTCRRFTRIFRYRVACTRGGGRGWKSSVEKVGATFLVRGCNVIYPPAAFTARIATRIAVARARSSAHVYLNSRTSRGNSAQNFLRKETGWNAAR